MHVESRKSRTFKLQSLLDLPRERSSDNCWVISGPAIFHLTLLTWPVAEGGQPTWVIHLSVLQSHTLFSPENRCFETTPWVPRPLLDCSIIGDLPEPNDEDCDSARVGILLHALDAKLRKDAVVTAALSPREFQAILTDIADLADANLYLSDDMWIEPFSHKVPASLEEAMALVKERFGSSLSSYDEDRATHTREVIPAVKAEKTRARRARARIAAMKTGERMSLEAEAEIIGWPDRSNPVRQHLGTTVAFTPESVAWEPVFEESYRTWIGQDPTGSRFLLKVRRNKSKLTASFYGSNITGTGLTGDFTLHDNLSNEILSVVLPDGVDSQALLPAILKAIDEIGAPPRHKTVNGTLEEMTKLISDIRLLMESDREAISIMPGAEDGSLGPVFDCGMASFPVRKFIGQVIAWFHPIGSRATLGGGARLLQRTTAPFDIVPARTGHAAIDAAVNVEHFISSRRRELDLSDDQISDIREDLGF
jgi:hypothetical protein